MIRYADGTEMRVGDAVLIEHGQTPGTVVHVIISPEEIGQLSVDGAGVMLESEPFGLVFLPFPFDDDDPIMFVSSGED